VNPQQEIALLEQLLQELLSGIQEVLQSGEILTDEFQGLLARELESVTSRLDELRSQNPVENLQNAPPPPNVPQLDQGPFPSSNVNSFKYNPDTGELFVKFHGKDSADTGPVYSYQGVPRNIYDVFSRGRVAPKTSGQNQYHRWIRGVTPSLGASLYALIRNGGYPYQRLS
jgi:hypothetical protein